MRTRERKGKTHEKLEGEEGEMGKKKNSCQLTNSTFCFNTI